MNEKQLRDALAQAFEQQASTLAKALNGNDQHTKTPASYPTYTELHGQGGIFSTPGLDRDVISAHLRPMGISSMMPLLPSIDESPRFGALAGFSDDQGDEPSYPCDDAPTGFTKAANLTATFGRIARDTETIEINKVMLRVNRGDFNDLVLRGRVMGMTDLNPSEMNESDLLNLVTKSEMINAGIRMERKLTKTIWQGAITNNNAGGGYKEFPGLDAQIATGQVDADTNTAVPALDSLVLDFAYNSVDGTTLDIVEYVSYMEYYLRDIATRTGMDPVQWVVCMPQGLWFELSAVWPCSYLTHRCATSSGSNPMVINDNVNVQMRDAMRNGMYIDINGNRYPVVIDDGIFEHNNINNANLNPAEYAASIYFVPMTVTGNWPVLYREHLDYRASARDTAFLRGTEEFWTDNGVWYWASEVKNWCYKLKVKTEQRVILRTPQLAGRIDAVKYSPLQHLRSPMADSPYWSDGGVSMRTGTTSYAVWGTVSP
jgi:hypothetical protein